MPGEPPVAKSAFFSAANMPALREFDCDDANRTHTVRANRQNQLLEQAMNTANVNYNFLPCPCCGSRVLTMLGEYEICDVCGWEDDPVQSADPDYAGGANKLSLKEARKEWSDRQSKA